jgi:SAM-dependent methyltransferase
VKSDLYSDGFFSTISDGALRSAKQIAPLILDIARPVSAVDVGCGTGAFLACLKTLGVQDVLGIDGDWAKPALSPGEFRSADLSKPLAVDRRFDLVVSLEVAEHLEPGSAAVFVDSLTRLGPIVLFSAAIPFQGGVGHLNEQWPDYWAGLFAERGFELVDCIRMKLWHNTDVEWWYAQNTFLYVERDRLRLLRHERGELLNPGPASLRMPHPENYRRKGAAADQRSAPSSVVSIVRRIVRRMARFGRSGEQERVAH